MGQQLAALDASMHPAATQHAAHQQHVAACWLISGCCGLICRLADPPADRAFRRCMRLVLHSGAAVQQLLADAPTDLLTAQVVVQLWAVTAWAAIAVSLETDSGVHSVPPALLHVWLQQTVESLGVLATVLQKQGGQRWVAPRGAEDLPGISALCMLLAILFVLILHAHFIFGLDQPFAEGVAKLRSTLATLLGMLCTSPALAAHRQQLLNNEELCVQLFGVLQPAVPALAVGLQLPRERRPAGCSWRIAAALATFIASMPASPHTTQLLLVQDADGSRSSRLLQAAAQLLQHAPWTVGSAEPKQAASATVAAVMRWAAQAEAD